MGRKIWQEKFSTEVEDRRGEHLSRVTAFINRRNIPPFHQVSAL